MKLYMLKNAIGWFYVLAEHPTEAQKKLEDKLSEAEYGFTSERKTTEIRLLSTLVDSSFNGKPFFSSENTLIM